MRTIEVRQVATMIVKPTKSVKRFLSRRDGSTAVEFGLIAAPFIGLLLACLQTGLAYLSSQALELATEKSARLVLTGQAQSMSQSQFLSTVCSKLPSLLTCANTIVDVQTYSNFASSNTGAPTITYNKDGSIANTWQYSPGGPGSIVVLRVMYLLPVISAPDGFGFANMSGGRRLLMATAVFQNEPYK